MAEKYPLSIVLQAVDRATAPVKRLTETLEKVNAPARLLSDRFRALGKAAGLPQLAAGFRSVASEVGALALKLGALAGIAGYGFLKLVDTLDDLGDLAPRLGLSVDALVQLQYAAERSGASAQDLNQAMRVFNQNVGYARAGIGPLTSLLQKVSPKFLRQLKATKGNEEALRLLADAMAKIQDPTKRAALAAAAFGGQGAAMIPLLGQGSDGIDKLRHRYLELAGPQADAASKAGALNDQLQDLHAATDGVKAALVKGLAPILENLAQKMTKFLTGHREQIAQWIRAFAQRIPTAIRAAGQALSAVVDFIRPAWEAIGGLKGAAVILSVVLAGRLVASIAKLGVVIATNPLGLLLTGLAGLVVAGQSVVHNWKLLKAVFGEVWDSIVAEFQKAWGVISGILDKILDKIHQIQDIPHDLKAYFTGGDTAEEERARRAANTPAAIKARLRAQRRNIELRSQGKSEDENGIPLPVGAVPQPTHIKVEFANAPRGTRATVNAPAGVRVDSSMGVTMGGPG